MNDVQIFDRSNIDTLNWPNTPDGILAQKHLLPLIKEGPEKFIQNAKTKLYILTVDDLIIPISVNEGEYQNCYLLSSYFMAAHLKEKIENSSLLPKLLLNPLLTLFSGFLKLMKINKVVILNNWLLTTNLYPDLTEAQIKSITDFLKQKFPDHYFMFRSINTYNSSLTYNALNLGKYRLIPCRNVYLYDPKKEHELTHNQLRKQKKDANRLKSKKYEVEEVTYLSEAETSRVLELYKNVYVKRYTKFSPQYTKEYLENILKNQSFKFILLKKEGQIYGVSGFLQKNDHLVVPFFGYDTSISQEEGLYRMLSSIIMTEIDKTKLVSHQGSGAGQFKQWRGFFEYLEYVGIYDKHLPFFRRLFWSLSEKFTPLFIKQKKPPLKE